MNKQKVVLYNPIAVFFDMPLALLSLASNLDRDRFEPVIVDARLRRDARKAVLEQCEGAVCLGITVLTGAPLKDALELTREVKAKYPNLPIIWGGWHPSLFGKEILKEEKTVDITVQGQGEITFREIVERLAAGELPEDISGCTFRREGEIVQNPPRLMTDMNDLATTDYSLIDVPAYFQKKNRPQMDYISSTGCFFRCAFCADPFVYQRKWKGIDPERMGEELAYLHRKYEFTDLNFQDETFFTYTKRSVAVAEQFLSRNIRTTWAGTLRADQCTRMSDAEFETIVKSGFRRALIGVESGTQEMMDWLKKDIKIEQVWESAERCAAHGVGGIFPFIVGFPGESDESVEASLRMAYRLSAMRPNFSTPIFYFKPYPGSDITRKVVENGYQLPETLEDWANFDYIGSSGPWVDRKKYRKVERFKFYNKLAGAAVPMWARPLKSVAKMRCKTGMMALPVEKKIINLLRPEQQLS